MMRRDCAIRSLDVATAAEPVKISSCDRMIRLLVSAICASTILNGMVASPCLTRLNGRAAAAGRACPLCAELPVSNITAGHWASRPRRSWTQ